jgi:hypothetical protein
MPNTTPRTSDTKGIDSYTIQQLKTFLKARRVRSSGNKAELLQLAKLYRDRPIISTSTERDACDLFSRPSLQWEQVSDSAKVSIPGFSIVTISTYLTTHSVTLSRDL